MENARRRVVRAGLMAAVLSAPASAPASTHYKVLYNFPGTSCSYGVEPNGLVADHSGNFFGTTVCGGEYDFGVVFELSPGKGGSYSYNVLYNFISGSGGLPVSSPIVGMAGDLYGITSVTSDSSYGGVAYKLVHGSKWKYHILYSWCDNCGGGFWPLGGLAYSGIQAGALYDGKSPLFGTTFDGGTGYNGVVFSLQPVDGTWTYTDLYDFCSSAKEPASCTDAGGPHAALMVGATGSLYGVTEYGGSASGGTVFELRNGKHGWTKSLLHEFCSEGASCPDGAYPVDGLATNASGTELYGVTPFGGNYPPCSPSQCGVAFALAIKTKREAVLHRFCEHRTLPRPCRDGDGPDAPLIDDANGNWFGTAASGGDFDNDQASGGGTFLEFIGSEPKILHQFCGETNCMDGERPGGSVVRDSSGTFFGTTTRGGTHDAGVIYEFKP